ncbi:MAG: type II secretion system protein [Betaproteobacteria bacterium]
MTRKSGFTLIELLITVAIVSLLASIALPLSELSFQRAKEQELRRSLREIREALDAYKRHVDEGRIRRAADGSGYPATLAVLVEGAEDLKSPTKARLRFLRRIPRDPMSGDDQIPAESSWGLRSYDSPHEDPRPGKDVFDVYSSSAAAGLNGIPYKDW